MPTPGLPVPSPEASIEETESMPGRVLIVDDVPANVRLLSGILKVEGFEVASASGGAEALAKLEEQAPGEGFDVVLMDVMMPGMDGFEACRRIRARPWGATLPVVMVTALQDTPDRVRAIEAGADDFLSKPIEEVEVVARVRSLVRAKRSRDALEGAYERLREAEELREGMASMLVHDLRTPLTTMMVSLDLLQSSFQAAPSTSGASGAGKAPPASPPASPPARPPATPPAWQSDVVEMSLRSGRHLLGLINQLLDLSRLESGEMALEIEPSEPASLIEEAVAQVAGQAERAGIDIRSEAAAATPVEADANLVRRVLINLLGNALQHSRATSAIHIGAREERGEVVFSVRDEGAGIAPEDHERIFDKWAQARAHAHRHEEGPGTAAGDGTRGRGRASTGLGLTFCKLAVEAHGGRIWVESRPGAGATFSFALPVRQLESQ